MAKTATVREKLEQRGTAPDASEDAIQSLVFLRVHDLCLELQDERIGFIHSVPNGGGRDKVSAALMVATGVKSGIWDITIPFPSGIYPFAAIEMKRPMYRTHKNGGLSDAQVAYGRHLFKIGAWCAVCYSADEAIAAIRKYLRGEPFYA